MAGSVNVSSNRRIMRSVIATAMPPTAALVSVQGVSGLVRLALVVSGLRRVGSAHQTTGDSWDTVATMCWPHCEHASNSSSSAC